MKCSNCGKEIAAGSKFCTYCGTPVRNSQDGNPADKGPHPYETELSASQMKFPEYLKMQKMQMVL